MKVDCLPDAQVRASRQMVEIPFRSPNRGARGHLRVELAGPPAPRRKPVERLMGRLGGIVGNLHGQATPWVQPLDQPRKQPLVIGDPVQHGVGQDDIEAVVGFPGFQRRDLEPGGGLPGASRRDHRLGAIQSPQNRAPESVVRGRMWSFPDRNRDPSRSGPDRWESRAADRRPDGSAHPRTSDIAPDPTP